MIAQKKRNIIGLMGTTLINNVLYMFLNTFMVSYFVTLTNYDYKIISLYYIASFIFIMLTFLLLGKIIKEKMKVPIYRVGIVFYCIYILMIALLKEKIVDYYLYLGTFYGIVQGLFWSAGHSLINQNVADKSNSFISVRSMISKTLKIIFPIIFGVSIELTSFSYIARIILILSFLQFSFSLLIKEEQTEEKKKYNLKEYFEYLRKNTNKKMKSFYNMVVCDGIVSYLLETIITLMIVITFKENISLGILTTIYSVFSIISVYIFQNRLKNNKTILKISTVGIVLSIVLLVIDISKTTIILYNFISSVFLVLLRNNAEEKRYAIVNSDEKLKENYLVEHQIVSELSLNISRIIGYALLFVASLSINMVILKVLLGIIALIVIAYAKMMIDIGEDKKHIKHRNLLKYYSKE